MAKQSDWATYGMMEVPYWRNGMSMDEYEAERKYYYEHIEDVKNGTYMPMWKKGLKPDSITRIRIRRFGKGDK